MHKEKISSKGFSIFTLIIGIGVVAILAVGIFVFLNPSKRLGQSYNARRWTDINALAKAIELYSLDNQALPADFSTGTLSVAEKFVLCSSEGALECDGETLGCLVVNDTDFLGQYLETLPVDPLKSDTSDTGYYISRQGDNMLVIGACDSYNNESISLVAKAALPTLVAICGDGDVEGAEVCDDGDTFTEGCLNGLLESAGTYCNANCTAQVVIGVNEACDSNGIGGCYDDPTTTQYYDLTQASKACGTYDYCSSDCTSCIVGCIIF
ncbi:hypothetical protein C4566_03020 [Candidatus Parcubacteria bacterium]|nr:MAG: hypothetical protein C4566_03020 [Candidatus Parcubacteria bacterium]